MSSITRNTDFKYDLMLGEMMELSLRNILQYKKIEVKTDKKAHETKNVFVEYQSRDKKSGIATTQADYYCFVIGYDRFIFIAVDDLKEKCRRYKNTDKDVRGGDDGTSRGILLPISELLEV